MPRSVVLLGALLLSAVSALVGLLAGGGGHVPIAATRPATLVPQTPSFAEII